MFRYALAPGDPSRGLPVLEPKPAAPDAPAQLLAAGAEKLV